MNESLQKKLHFCADVIGARTAGRTQRTQAVLRRHLPELIQRTCHIRSTGKCLQQRLLPEIISRWKTLKAQQHTKNKACGHLFNPLAAIPIGEVIHSCLLGDLLNPNGSHGQDRLLLDAFLESIGVPAPGEGEWMISIEDGKVDICLRRKSPASVVFIENKSNWAKDQPNQLYRYWHQNIYKPHPLLDYSMTETKQSFQIIYLPPTAGKQPSHNTLMRPEYLDDSGLPKTLGDVGVTVKVLTYRDHITAWLDHCDQLIPATNTRLGAHLQFYKELWS